MRISGFSARKSTRTDGSTPAASDGRVAMTIRPYSPRQYGREPVERGVESVEEIGHDAEQLDAFRREGHGAGGADEQVDAE